ncbi:hypothetical protein X943_000594 [Babesia divergens]|uniref:Uncharacterized protein n=1 Tax=Babesia divergens TaxID=32595 RepID=A0AAD9LJS9_BABDI|nr:hypothetical protein X943_000594 [Babesia divergens]
MAEQRIMPRTGKQQIKKNVLEVTGGVMLNNLCNRSGNSLTSVGGMKIPGGKASLDKAGGERLSSTITTKNSLLLSEPIVEILFGAVTPINILVFPMPSLDAPRLLEPMNNRK